jgi:hypothetical protein
MSKLYGCWLISDFSAEALCQEAEFAKKKYYPLFLKRAEAINGIAEKFIEDTIERIPALEGKLFISHPALISAVGRYVNDIMHYKMWHNVRFANKAKMIAHTIKWLSQYHVVTTSITSGDYQKLSPGEKSYVLEMNTIFINTVIRYFLAHFCHGEVPSSTAYAKFFYLLDTAQYDEKTASVAFEGIII